MIKIPFEIVVLEDESYHLLVACSIGGKSSFLVIDTGASKTVFDSNFITDYSLPDEEQKIKSQGVGEEQFVTQMVEVADFIIGESTDKLIDVSTELLKTDEKSMRIDTLRCALIDLSVLNAMYEQHCNRKICGLLGSDLLLKYNAIIDYQRKTLHLQPNFESNEN